MKNEKLNTENITVFTEESVKKQLETLFKHLGDNAKSKVEETLKKIIGVK